MPYNALYSNVTLMFVTINKFFPLVFAYLRSRMAVLRRRVTLFKIERYGGLFFAQFPLVLLRKGGMLSHARLQL